MAAVGAAKQTGETTTYMLPCASQAGALSFGWSRACGSSPILRPARLSSAISVTRDITARKKFEDELQSARERAEAASATKSRFLANMSHELRTPLNAIIGFSDILAREMFGPLSPRYVEYSQLINDSGAMLLDLINDLLDMSKIEAGKFELHYEDVPVGESIASEPAAAWRGARRKAASRSSRRVTPGDLRLRADKRAFRQILLNLISNAVKFTEQGRDGSRWKPAPTEVNSGSPCATPASAFRKTSCRASHARSSKRRTIRRARMAAPGLGLALVKSLTQLHGGEFSIQSEVGHGTEVTVTLPLEPAAGGARRLSALFHVIGESRRQVPERLSPRSDRIERRRSRSSLSDPSDCFGRRPGRSR